MNEKLRVLYVSPEISPCAKSGQLGDTARALIDFLSPQGLEISAVLPKYRRPEIESLNPGLFLPDILVPLGADKVKANVFRADLGRVPVYFIDNPKYFYRDMIYGSAKGEYLDNDERFTFFGRAVPEFLLKSKLTFDIIHCNNWPTALVPVFLRTHYAQKNHFKEVATVFSVHDVTSQGQFPPESLALTGLNWDYFTPEQLALNGQFNFLKAGMIFADALVLSGPATKAEIPAVDSGNNLEGILARRKDAVAVIRNGHDHGSWERAAKEHLEIYRKARQLRTGGQGG